MIDVELYEGPVATPTSPPQPARLREVLAPPVSAAIVHDYLNQRGGAERVVLEMSNIWPDATIYTSLYRPNSTHDAFKDLPVATSALNAVPVDAGFRALAPLYPAAFRQLGTFDQDVVISSTSGWAHGVRTAPDSLHVAYCYTPARWIYRSEDHLGDLPSGKLLKPLISSLRRWDQRAASKVDVYVATCENVRQRINDIYDRECYVVNPPVEIDRFVPEPAGDRLLVISRLLPYKRVDLMVKAADAAGIGLDVVGVGPCMRSLTEMASDNVRFWGAADDHTVRLLLQNCRALCVAADEDFGLTPLEANAAGKPVVAYASGGVLETQIEDVTASFFRELSTEAVVDAIDRAARIDTAPETIAAAATRFSAPRFRDELGDLVTRALDGERP